MIFSGKAREKANLERDLESGSRFLAEDFQNFTEIRDTIEEIRLLLGDSGRMNVRYSGTEPLARIMIEGEDQGKIEEYARWIADVISKYLSH